MIHRIKLRTLVKVSAYCGLATITMGIATRYKLNLRITETEYYTEAMTILKSHPGAIQLLGEPIRDKMLDVGEENINYTKELTARYEVPVQGSKQRGIMYFWANRLSAEDKWMVDRIELGFKNHPGRRLLVKGIVHNVDN